MKQHCKNYFTEWNYFPTDLCLSTTCKPRPDNQLRLNKSDFNFNVYKQTLARLCCEGKHAWFIIKSIQYDTHQTLFTIYRRKKQSGQDLTDSRTSVIEYSDNNSPLLVQPTHSILRTLQVWVLWFLTKCITAMPICSRVDLTTSEGPDLKRNTWINVHCLWRTSLWNSLRVLVFATDL